MYKYRSKCRWNMLLQIDSRVIEIRPGEFFQSKEEIVSRFLDPILPKKRKKKELDGSSSPKSRP